MAPKQKGMMTPQEYQEQMAKNNLTDQKYGYEMSDNSTATPEVKAKQKTNSILIINLSFVAILLAGIIGSFVSVFDMDKFTSFLEVFAYVWAPLVIAVAGGTSIKNWSEKKYTPKGTTPDQNAGPPQ